MVVVLGLIFLVSLLMIPLGLPGIWVMILAAMGAVLLGSAVKISWYVLLACVGIAMGSELLDLVLAARYTRKYGGSRRGAWGAIIGGIVGAIVGVPVPIIGSVIGALAGSFLGALLAEYTTGATHGGATRAATGATIGRVVATAFKVAAGCVIAAWLLGAALV